MARRRLPIRGVWAVLALIAGWAVMYVLLTTAVPKDKRQPDPDYPESERLSPILEPPPADGPPKKGSPPRPPPPEPIK